ncbi:LINE-1 reverse transcriptase homolog [Linum perenne]
MDTSRRGRRRFYYENGWAEAEGYGNCVIPTWRRGCSSTYNLKEVATALTKWKRETIGVNKDEISYPRKKKDEISRLLKDLQRLEADGSQTDNAEEKSIREKPQTCWKIEENYWAQRAGTTWLRLGDKNTKFFHASAVQRRKRNLISKLKDSSGVWIDEAADIEKHISDFYKELFRDERRVTDLSAMRDYPTVIDQSMQAKLDGPILEWEIKNAVFQMGPSKSPGPDGYPGSFFQRHWMLIKDDLISEIQGFFQNHVFPEGWNITNLTLIPKVRSPKSISQYRPISVANFRATVISKVLANRLKPFIPGMVSELQSAFTGNRSIQDSIIIVHEVMHKLKNRKKGKKYDFLLKLDMQKAYDRINWNFLLTVMEMMGFGENWLKWTKEIVSSDRFSVLVNGHSVPAFKPTRGLRQGDPLSPFLFILASNALSFMLQKEVCCGSLMGIRLNPRCPILSHVMFADDTVIFGKAEPKEMKRITEVLRTYCIISGQTVNENKSAMFFSSNTPQERKIEIAAYLNIDLSRSLGNYLGLPAEWGRSKSEAFNFMLERLSTRAEGWKSVLLSTGGREVMIKSILQAIPSYLFSVFLLPDRILKRMNAIVARFWWAGDARRRTIHWCSIDRLTEPKRAGGLGFRSFREFNLSFLAKLAWKIIQQPEALWVRLLKALYFPSTDFISVPKHRRSSWIWTSVLKGREALLQGLRRSIGNGRDTWIDEAWFPGTEDFRCHPNPRYNCRVADCIDHNRRCWRIDKLREIFPESTIREIIMIPIAPPNWEDKWLWHDNKVGNFTVKSCYSSLKKAGNNPNLHRYKMNEEEWRWLWQLSIPSKIKLFLWKCCTNTIPTMKNLHKRNCCPSPVCVCCGQNDESAEHMLFECSGLGQLWEEAFPGKEKPNGGMSFIAWLKSIKEEPLQQNTMKYIGYCWTKWKMRNDIVFNNDLLNISGMKRRMDKEVSMWENLKTPRPSANPSPSTINEGSDPLPTSHRKVILCDGSFQQDVQKAGIGVVMFASEGHKIDGTAGHFFCRTPGVAEAYAILAAARMASRENEHVIIKSDCLEVINALATRSEWPWEYAAIIDDIRTILQSTTMISVTHCKRSEIGVAHNIANRARMGLLLPNWLAELDHLQSWSYNL